MTAVKPCPFCGIYPRIEQRKRHTSIWCDNVSCLEVILDTSDVSNAERIWNRRASPWRPISTAPRDGTPIIVFGLGPAEATLVVEFDASAKNPEYPWATLDGPNYRAGAFTHWMPTPEGPDDEA